MLVRPATPDDALAVARVHVRSWQAGYRGLMPAAVLDDLRAEERAERYTFGSTGPNEPHTLVAVDDGAILGFATTAPSRDEDADGAGELCALYVDPDRWRAGVGRELITAARARLIDQGYARADLWVLVGNDRAQAFYRTDGWSPEGSQRQVVVWGVPVDEVRFRRRLV